MGKLLLLILLGILAYLVFTRAARARKPDARPRPADAKIVPCARCGLHIPADEGIAADGLFYCCEEHRRLGQD